jgi:hypothetical protein
MKTLVRLFSSFFVLLMIASLCPAEMMSIGEPAVLGSWTQRFQEDGVYSGTSGNYDLIAVQIVPVATFETPTLSNISDGSWALFNEDSSPTPTTATALGTTTSATIQFDVKFAGDKATPLSFNYVAYNGETLRGGGTCSWDGSSWTCVESSTPLNWTPTRTQLVPEPGMIALLGIAAGLGCMVRIWRRC